MPLKPLRGIRKTRFVEGWIGFFLCVQTSEMLQVPETFALCCNDLHLLQKIAEK